MAIGSTTSVFNVPKVTPPKPSAPVSKPSNDLGNGDLLLDTLKLNAKHEIQIINRTDRSQYLPFLAKCKCGSEGRSKFEKDVREWAERHFVRHEREVVL